MSNEELADIIERLIAKTDPSAHGDLLHLVKSIISLQQENASLWDSWKQLVGKE